MFLPLEALNLATKVITKLYQLRNNVELSELYLQRVRQEVKEALRTAEMLQQHFHTHPSPISQFRFDQFNDHYRICIREIFELQSLIFSVSRRSGWIGNIKDGFALHSVKKELKQRLEDVEINLSSNVKIGRM